MRASSLGGTIKHASEMCAASICSTRPASVHDDGRNAVAWRGGGRGGALGGAVLVLLTIGRGRGNETDGRVRVRVGGTWFAEGWGWGHEKRATAKKNGRAEGKKKEKGTTQSGTQNDRRDGRKNTSVSLWLQTRKKANEEKAARKKKTDAQ